MKKIISAENKILRKPVSPVADPASKDIRKLIKDMSEAMFAEPDGIGIAAPQIGAGLKVFLVAEDVLYPERLADEKKRTRNFFVFINPGLKRTSKKKSKDMEGCLSVRGKYGEVERPEKITVEYTDESGGRKSRGASGLFARVIQHEMDHLEGMLFIDKAKNIRDEATGR